MTAVAITAPTLVEHTRTPGMFWYHDAITWNSNQCMQITWTIPHEGRSGVWALDSVVFTTTTAAATATTLADEAGYVMLENSAGIWLGPSSVGRALNSMINHSDTDANGVTIRFAGWPHRFYSGDRLEIDLPPIDDNAAGTADGSLLVGLRAID